MLPNFFVVGAQKAATTSLHNYLAGHPDVYLPAQKETKFFVEDRFYKKGIHFYQEEYFSECTGETAVGEVDPDYMFFENALDYMGEHLDLANTKFIFLLRDPVDRAFSHYLMTFRRGLELLSFEDAIEQESARIASGGFDEKEHFSYVSRGFYLRQIEHFLSKVSRSQMLFLFTEDLKRDPDACLEEVFRFLGVTTEYMPDNLGDSYHGAKVPLNAALQQRIAGGMTFEKRLLRILVPWKPWREKLRNGLLMLNQRSGKGHVMSDKARCALISLYRTENQRLEQFLGRDLKSWKHTDPAQGTSK